jgi:hypothetical protein
MLLALLLAIPLSLTPGLPEGTPDTGSWDVVFSGIVSRTAAMDVVRVPADSLKFIQQRNICPAEAGADCPYLVFYELRRKVVDGKMTAFVQRFVAVGPTLERVEGVAEFDYARLQADPATAFRLFYRKNDRWLSEEFNTEEFIVTLAFFEMLGGISNDRELSLGSR